MSQSDLGVIVEHYMQAGHLVPDHHVNQIVFERLSRKDVDNGFVMDGYPRTLPQVDSFVEFLRNKSLQLNGVVFIDVSDEAVIYRMADVTERLEQRRDDTEPIIRERMGISHRETDPVVARYRDHNQLIVVNGNDHPDNVFKQIKQQLDPSNS